MALSVGAVASASGITVRTLHHYDAIGLLTPSGRSAAGYRQYEDQDIERLERILYYRELGFPLEEVGELLDDPGEDALTHLRRQHDLVSARLERLRAMASALEHEMEAHTMGYRLTPEERLEVFGDFVPEDHEEEAADRWGGTDAYAESARRTKAYTADDWRRIKAEADETTAAFIAAMAAGKPADSGEATAAAEAHRAHLTRWFYDCGYEMQCGLADMYVSDPRFTAAYDDQAPGLARYIADAIHANAIQRS